MCYLRKCCKEDIRVKACQEGISVFKKKKQKKKEPYKDERILEYKLVYYRFITEGKIIAYIKPTK